MIEVKILGILVGEAEEFDFTGDEEAYHGVEFNDNITISPDWPIEVKNADDKYDIGIDYSEGILRFWSESVVIEYDIKSIMGGNYLLYPNNIHVYGNTPGDKHYHDLTMVVNAADKIREVIEEWESTSEDQNTAIAGSA